MAPKAAAKKEVKVEPSTPKPKVKNGTAETPKKTPSTSARKPKVTAAPRDYKVLPVDEGASGLDVKYEGSLQAAAMTTGGYSMPLKLEATNAFSLVKLIDIEEGPYAGYPAILIRPAKPFKFMELPEIVRNTVYRMYFAPKGLTDSTTPIVLDGKRTTDKVPYSKSYAEGSKSRVGLLAVSKMVNAEAAAMLYSHPLRFESTMLLGEFLAEYRSTRSKIFNVEVKAYKKGARMALTLLAESPNLRRLRFEAGVSNDGDPRKAAKAFYLEAAQLLESIGKQKQEKEAGVDVLEFAKGSLTVKDGDKAKNYSEEMMELFVESLRALCK